MPRLSDLLPDNSSRRALEAIVRGAGRARRRVPRSTGLRVALPAFVALDVETTGLDARVDRIIEVAAVKFVAGREAEVMSCLVNPGRPVPAEVTVLTGITDADLVGAPPFATVRDALREFIGSLPLCGHQVDFDVGFLDEEFRRAGQAQLANPLLDTANLARLTLPDLAGYTLTQVCAALDVPLAKAHRALDDARAAGLAALRLIALLDTMGAGVRQVLIDFAPRSLLRTVLSDSLRRSPGGVPPPRDTLPRWERLNAGDTPVCLAEHEVRRAFGAEGLGRVLPGYAERPQQTRMALMIAEALNDGALLAVEAGTGTGKSLAYLVPAAMAAMATGRRAIISTHTRNLQDQLAAKDLPVVSALLEGRLRYAVLKGRDNYLCRARYRRLLRGELVNLAPREREALLPLIRWAEETETGDIEEQRQFNRRRHSKVWAAISAGASSCGGRPCEIAGECFLQRARQRAAGAHVVVVNHALFFTDVMAQSSWFLDTAGVVVFDEAHHLEECGHRCLCVSVDTRRMNVFLELCTDLVVRLERQTADRREEEMTADLKRNLRTLRHAADDLLASVSVWAAGVSAPGREISVAVPPRAIESLPAFGAFMTVLADFQDTLLRLQRTREASDSQSTCLGDIQAAAAQTSQLKADMAYLAAAATDEHVFWVEGDRTKGWVKLCGTPLDIGAVLTPIWAERTDAVVFTSATLSVAGTMDYYARRVGLAGPNAARLRCAILPSPFAPAQAIRLVLRSGPDPTTPEFTEFCADTIAVLQRRFRRNTLVLFTANAMMRDVEQALRRRLDTREFPLFSQAGGQSRSLLMQLFKRSTQAVLLGAASFWEGVDAPGEECEMVVIPRLPFLVPTEPLTQALAAKAEAEFGESFYSYAVPEAIIRLRQGAGRLIRSPGDRGALVLLDHRIATKSYGRAFASSLDGELRVVDSTDVLLKELAGFFSGSPPEPAERLRYVPLEEEPDGNGETPV